MSEEQNKSKVQKPKVSKLAIIAFGLSLVGGVLFIMPLRGPVFKPELFRILLFCTAGIALGIMTLIRIVKRRENRKGVIFAILAVALGIVTASMSFSDYQRYETGFLPCRMKCSLNLMKLSRGLFTYAAESDEQFPTSSSWCDLMLQSGHVNRKHLICKGAKINGDKGPCHYAINPNAGLNSNPDLVLVFETEGGWNKHGERELLTLKNHDGKGCNVLFADGHVEWIKAKDVNTLKWEVNEVATQLKTGDKSPEF